MIRHIKIARDSAVKSKSQAMITLKTLIINAPAELRASLDQIRGPITLVRHISALRPGEITSPTASAKAALRALAQRWLSAMAWMALGSAPITAPRRNPPWLALA
jgi:hypothetical protein